MLKERVITAIVLAAAFLLALFMAPGWLWTGLVLAAVWVAAAEWGRLSGLQQSTLKLYGAALLLTMGGILWLDTQFGASGKTWLHLPFYVLSVMVWVFAVPAWLISGWRPQMRCLLAATGALIIWGFAFALLDLRDYNPWALLFAMCMVWIADIAAYFSGRRFGKTKLAPSISPGKTWEGVFGALAAVSLFVVGCWLAGWLDAYPRFFPGMVMASWWWVGLSVIGDLFESAIKRQAGVKDSGALLPGHGGLLDRIDALTSTLPFAALALMLQRLE